MQDFRHICELFVRGNARPVIFQALFSARRWRRGGTLIDQFRQTIQSDTGFWFFHVEPGIAGRLWIEPGELIAEPGHFTEDDE